MKAAALALVISACGDGLALPDASAPPDGDGGGIVTVRIVQTGEPAFVGRGTVYFQDRGSTLALVVRPGTDGRASAYMRPDGFVTFVPDATTGARPLYTYAGVQPGDALVIGPESFDRSSYINVRVPPAAGVTGYNLVSTCGFVPAANVTSAQGADGVLFNCGDRTDILATATTPAGLRYTYHADIALVPPPSSAMVTLAVPAQGRSLVRVHVNGAPEDRQISLNHAIVMGQERPFDIPVPLHANNDWTWDFDLPVFPAATTRTILNGGAAILVDWGPARSSVDFDYTDLLLPAQLAPLRYDATAHSLVWAEADDAPRAQWTRATIRWSYDAEFFRWEVLAPRGDATRIDLPTLPHPLLVPNPNTLFLDAIIRLRVTGAAAEPLHGLLGRWERGEWPITGETGRVVYQSLATD